MTQQEENYRNDSKFKDLTWQQQNARAEWQSRQYDFHDLKEDLKQGLVGRTEQVKRVKKWLWEHRQTGGRLWIGGKAGVGKSAFMTKLTDELEDNPELCIVPYYFRYGDGRCTPERFYEAAILKLSAELAIAEKYDLREPPQVQFARALKASLQQETGDARDR